MNRSETSVVNGGSKLLYKQVKDYILGKIQTGVFRPGQDIPPERELCKTLDVSRYTVRKAIQELVKEGYLYRVQGNGTFVFDKGQTFRSKTEFIGVVLPSCDTEMEMRILNGIQAGLMDTDYKMTFVDSNNDYQREAEHIQRLKNEGVAGLIIMPAENQKDSTAISDLKAEGFPFVLVDRKLQDCETDCVLSDNIEGGYIAVEHLIRLGHEKIAFVKHDSHKTSSVKDRIAGYRKALAEYGLEYNHVFSFHRDEDLSRLYSFLCEKQPTAIVTLNDYVALDVVKLCRERDIVIPDQLSIVSFDDLEIVRYLEVPLTTVAQESKEIGRKAVELLIQRINAMGGLGPKISYYTQIYYPTKLVERDSCLKLA